MTLLWTQCINGLNQVRVPGARLACGRIIGLQQVAHRILLRIELGELLPGSVVLQSAPDPLDRVQLRPVRREPDISHIFWPPNPWGGVRAAVIQEENIEAVGECLGEGIHKELKALGIQIRQFEKKALTCGGGDRAVDIEPFKDMVDWPHGLDTPDGHPPSAHRQQAKAAFVLTEHPHREAVLWRDDALEPLLAGRLELLPRVRVFLCGWAAAP
jgi:hypothetical protein